MLCREKQMASKGHLDDVRRNVMVVSELVDILGGEQKYLRRKLDRHIQTVVSRVGLLVPGGGGGVRQATYLNWQQFMTAQNS
jgi:hypothetical protein